jgi:hypothetical protein
MREAISKGTIIQKANKQSFIFRDRLDATRMLFSFYLRELRVMPLIDHA